MPRKKSEKGKKPQFPPLRFAPVGMTILLGNWLGVLVNQRKPQVPQHSMGMHSSDYPQNCHPDRSEAQWRDLRFFSEISSSDTRSLAPKVRLEAMLAPCPANLHKINHLYSGLKRATNVTCNVGGAGLAFYRYILQRKGPPSCLSHLHTATHWVVHALSTTCWGLYVASSDHHR
jgi:hypothetical protein